MSKPAKPCDCVKQVDEQLKPFNTCLAKSITMTTDGKSRSLGIALSIETSKLNSKVRGSKKTVMPTFCPFCGVKL